MVSSTIWEKLMSACFPQISRETILLLDNNLYIEMIEPLSTAQKIYTQFFCF